MKFFAPQKKKSISYQLSAISCSRGFTFVETLVAIASLLLAIVAPLSLVYQSLAASRVARNQVTAIYLAQESIEFIRGTRDNNALSGGTWVLGLEDCWGSKKACYIDIPDAEVAACTDGCPTLGYDPERYLYGYGDGTEDTVFVRTIRMEELQPDVEFEITVEVAWHEGTSEKNITVSDYIYNWQ